MEFSTSKLGLHFTPTVVTVCAADPIEDDLIKLGGDNFPDTTLLIITCTVSIDTEYSETPYQPQMTQSGKLH